MKCIAQGRGSSGLGLRTLLDGKVRSFRAQEGRDTESYCFCSLPPSPSPGLQKCEVQLREATLVALGEDGWAGIQQPTGVPISR